MIALVPIEPDADRPELCGSCEHWNENDNAEPFCAVFRRTLALVPGNLLKRADACLLATAAHDRLAAVAEAAQRYVAGAITISRLEDTVNRCLREERGPEALRSAEEK